MLEECVSEDDLSGKSCSDLEDIFDDSSASDEQRSTVELLGVKLLLRKEGLLRKYVSHHKGKKTHQSWTDQFSLKTLSGMC